MSPSPATSVDRSCASTHNSRKQSNIRIRTHLRMISFGVALHCCECFRLQWYRSVENSCSCLYLVLEKSCECVRSLLAKIQVTWIALTPKDNEVIMDLMIMCRKRICPVEVGDWEATCKSASSLSLSLSLSLFLPPALSLCLSQLEGFGYNCTVALLFFHFWSLLLLDNRHIAFCLFKVRVGCSFNALRTVRCRADSR